MADREDIDALLVGALYGELDETDRARLDAHLASHPQDRMSLDAMRSTRGLVRDADLAAAMVEPPAAVSALLLQEAARRAPVAHGAGAGGGILGFLASFLRPVMAHPALSAAAMLVVVAGTAGALYLNGSGRAVRPERTLPAEVATATGSAAAAPVVASDQQGADWLAAKEQTELERGRAQLAVREADNDKDEKGEAPALLGATAGSAALDSYRVSLDDGKDSAAGRDSARANGALAFDPEAKPPVAKGNQETAVGTGGYVEVARADEPTVRAPHEEGDGDLTLARGSQPPADQRAAISKLGQARPQAPSPAPPTAPGATSPAVDGLAAATMPDATGTFSLAPSNNAPGPTAGGAGSAGGAVMTDSRQVPAYNARSDAATLAWARDQHARMVKLVDAGKCNDAGTLGAQILRRAPDYYQDQVYNDRRVRACRAYVEKSRRAMEPARKRDLPSPAAADEAAAPERLN